MHMSPLMHMNILLIDANGFKENIIKITKCYCNNDIKILPLLALYDMFGYL